MRFESMLLYNSYNMRPISGFLQTWTYETRQNVKKDSNYQHCSHFSASRSYTEIVYDSITL